MARIASDEITLTRLAEPTAVRLYYAKVTSVPPTPPALPSPNPSTTLPSAPWSITEPAYTGGDTSTVYTTMVTSYGANYHVCGERQLYSAYEAAKAAWNKANGAVTEVRVEFAVSSSNVTPPTTGWTTAKPNKVVGQFIWTQTITTTGAGSSVTYGPALLTGDKGDQGAQGVSVTSITPYYRKLVSSASAPAIPTTMTPSGWSATEPAWEKDYVLYKTERVVLSNGSFQYTPVSKVEAWRAADKVQEDLANLQIGGRNLVTKSVVSVVGGTTQGYKYELSRALSGTPGVKVSGAIFEAATEYVASFWARKISGEVDRIGGHSSIGASATVFRDGVDISNLYFYWFSPKSGTGLYDDLPHFYEVRFKTQEQPSFGTIGDKNWYIQPNRDAYGPEYELELWGFQVERGNRATDWTPAPEDVDAEIETVKDSALYESRVEYAVNDSETTAPTSGWSTAQPTRAPGSFIWVRTVITYGSGSTSTTAAALLTGNTGSQGISFKSLAVYYMLLDRDELAPLTPTKMDPTVDAPGWTMVEPEWAENKNMWRTMRVVTSNNMFTWTPVSKVSTYQAADTAMGEAATARHYANMSLENVTVSATDPSTDEYGHFEGRIWMKVNDADEIINVVISDAGTWKTFSILGGLIVVPGKDGKPAFFADQNGVEVNDLVAGALLATEMVAGKFQTLEADITDTLDWKDEFPADSPKILKRVKITADGIVISNDQGAAAKSSMTLTSTELKLRADNTDIISLNAPLRESQTPLQYISKSLTLSQYQVQSPNGAPNVLSFIHVGSRS